jgi:DNA-binding NarL/FixJ family response regulator
MPPNVGRQRNTRGGAPDAGRAGIGVALVDAVPLYRDGLTALVARTPGLAWVGAADGANAALQMCERLRPDVVVVDSGVDPRNHLVHMLSGMDQRMGVLLLVRDRHRTTQYVGSAFAAGLQGAVLRSVEPHRVVEAIRAVHVERRYVDPALASTIAAPRSKLTEGVLGGAQPLSRREFQVLQLIADGLEHQAIAKILYVSVETVRTHVKSILRKLAARDRTHAVAVAFRSGVLSVTPDLNPPRPGSSPPAPGERDPRGARG